MASCAFGTQIQESGLPISPTTTKTVPSRVCKSIPKHFKDCLLTDEEYELGPGSWEHFKDPMPPIEVEEDDCSEGEYSVEQ